MTTTPGADLSRAEVRVLLALVAAGKVTEDAATDLLFRGHTPTSVSVADIVREAISANEADVVDRVSRVVETAIAHAVVRHVSRHPALLDAIRGVGVKEEKGAS